MLLWMEGRGLRYRDEELYMLGALRPVISLLPEYITENVAEENRDTGEEKMREADSQAHHQRWV